MACDTQPLKGQTLTERKAQVRDVVAKLASDLAAGRIKPVVGANGAIAFDGWTTEARGYVSDACAYRRLMVQGSPLAKAKIAAAELLSGRKVNRETVAAGHHSHDGGRTWHGGH